jgi:hypothetical protein
MSALAWMWFMLGRTLESVARPFGRAAIACETRAYSRLALAPVAPAALAHGLVTARAPTYRCCRCSCEALECATSDGKPDVSFLHHLKDPAEPRHVTVCAPCWREVGGVVIEFVELHPRDSLAIVARGVARDEELARVVRFLRGRANEAVLDGSADGHRYLLDVADALDGRIHRPGSLPPPSSLPEGGPSP